MKRQRTQEELNRLQILCICTAGQDRSIAVKDYLIDTYPGRNRFNTWAGGIREYGVTSATREALISQLLQADVIFAADTQHETFARGAIRAHSHALKLPKRNSPVIVNLHIRDYEKSSVEIPKNSIDRVMVTLGYSAPSVDAASSGASEPAPGSGNLKPASNTKNVKKSKKARKAKK